MYDKDRADECNYIRGDQYNRSWQYVCTDGGLTKQDCGQIRNDPQDLGVMNSYRNKIGEIALMMD
jgi:hypothetical protein